MMVCTYQTPKLYHEATRERPTVNVALSQSTRRKCMHMFTPQPTILSEKIRVWFADKPMSKGGTHREDPIKRCV